MIIVNATTTIITIIILLTWVLTAFFMFRFLKKTVDSTSYCVCLEYLWHAVQSLWIHKGKAMSLNKFCVLLKFKFFLLLQEKERERYWMNVTVFIIFNLYLVWFGLMVSGFREYKERVLETQFQFVYIVKRRLWRKVFERKIFFRWKNSS